MRIFNVMLRRKRGGTEQASLDYAQMLKSQGHDVINILSPRAAIIPKMEELGQEIYTVSNLFSWDPLSKWKLSKLLSQLKPDLVIAHHRRAVRFLQPLTRGRFPLASVFHVYAHSKYFSPKFSEIEAAIGVNQHLCGWLTRLGVKKAFHIPNVVTPSAIPPSFEGSSNDTVVIGSMGRMAAQKGFDWYIDALAILKAQGVPFEALLAGEGKLQRFLQNFSIRMGLEKHLSFVGWMSASKFLPKLDIFCLPSRFEPFGIVLLEAMQYGVPIVSTRAEGPREIFSPGKDGLIVPLNDSEALAAALRKLIENKALRKELAENAWKKLLANYTLDQVAPKLNEVANKIVVNFKKESSPSFTKS